MQPLAMLDVEEAGVGRRNETVRLTYPNGFWIEYEFAAKEGLPAKVIYKATRKKPDTDEDEEVTEEDRLAKPITIGQITAPWAIDHFTNGVQDESCCLRVQLNTIRHLRNRYSPSRRILRA